MKATPSTSGRDGTSSCSRPRRPRRRGPAAWRRTRWRFGVTIGRRRWPTWDLARGDDGSRRRARHRVDRRQGRAALARAHRSSSRGHERFRGGPAESRRSPLRTPRDRRARGPRRRRCHAGRALEGQRCDRARSSDARPGGLERRRTFEECARIKGATEARLTEFEARGKCRGRFRLEVDGTSRRGLEALRVERDSSASDARLAGDSLPVEVLRSRPKGATSTRTRALVGDLEQDLGHKDSDLEAAIRTEAAAGAALAAHEGRAGSARAVAQREAAAAAMGEAVERYVELTLARRSRRQGHPDGEERAAGSAGTFGGRDVRGDDRRRVLADRGRRRHQGHAHGGRRQGRRLWTPAGRDHERRHPRPALSRVPPRRASPATAPRPSRSR